MRLTTRTPAKVNLSLIVGPRDEAGYHELFTVFVPVDIYDEITLALEVYPPRGPAASATPAVGPGAASEVAPATGSASFRASGGASARARDLQVRCQALSGEANLAARALRALERRTGWKFRGVVDIEKGIPVAAGLGGGSSDAAAALLAGTQVLRAAGGPVLDRASMVAVARDIGADVAFFLDPRPSIGRGIGEILSTVEVGELCLVVITAAEPLSTARVYRAFAAARAPEEVDRFERRAAEAEQSWRRAPDVRKIARLMQNDLEKTVYDLMPGLRAGREALLAAGALAAQVSGSGPTLFGLYGSAAEAAEAAQALTEQGFRARPVTAAMPVPGWGAQAAARPAAGGEKPVPVAGAGAPGAGSGAGSGAGWEAGSGVRSGAGSGPETSS